MSDHLKLDLEVDVQIREAQRLRELHAELAALEADIIRMTGTVDKSARSMAALAKAAAGIGARPKGGDAGATEAAQGTRDQLAELRKLWAFQKRMKAQEKAEIGEIARAEREAARETEERFRDQMRFNTAMNRKREQDAKATEESIRKELTATAKMNDKAARQALDNERTQRRERDKAVSQVRTGAGQVRQGVGRVVTTGAAGAAGTAYAANRTVAALTRSGVDLDKAVNSNTRLSGLSPADADAKGKALVAKAAPIARELGIHTAEYLKARAEALQAGVDEQLVDAVTEFGSKYARLNDIAPSDVMESSGYGITALGAFGQVTTDKIKSLFNMQQHLAATTAASRTGLSSFVRRGLSSGAAAGFSLEDTLAYGGAATSSGADGESAARMLSSTTERLASMPTRAAGIARKKHKSPKDQLILQLPKKLGFNSWKDLKQAFSQDAAGSVEKIYEGLAAITDPRARLEASEEIWGKEFGSVHAAMAVGHRFRDMRQSVRSNEAGNAINSGMSIRSGSFDFIMDQIGSTFQSLKDGLGMVLKPFWKDLRDWAIQTPKAFETFDLAFKEGISGLLTGVGSPDGTMAGFLKATLGEPGSYSANAASVGSFMKGVGSGLKDIGAAASGFIRLFAGRDASAEEIGRWSARFLGLSAALIAAAPAVAILGGVVTAIGGLARMARGASTLVGLGRLMAGGTAMSGIGAGAATAAGWPVIGVIIGSSIIEYLTPRLADWLREKLGPGFLSNTVSAGQRTIVGGSENTVGGISTWILDLFRNRPGHAVGGYVSGPGGPTSDSVMARLSNGEFVVNAAAAARHGGLLEAINSGATPGFAFGGSVGAGNSSGGYVSPFASTRASDDMRSLASAINDLVRVLRFERGSRTTRARNLRYGIGGGGGGVGGSAGGGGGDGGTAPAVEGSTPGGALPSTGMRRRGIMAGGGGSASSNPANSAASARMLDAIAGTESGRAGYDAVLGNGRYGTPSKPVSTMTLDEAFAFGRQVRARHGSSSALGRYQIVGSTMRAAQRALNIPGDAVFDPAMQDRMARWVARNQGLGAWQGLRRNPAAMAQAQAALAQGGAADAPVASAGGSSGGSGPPQVGNGSGRSQGHIEGQLQMEGQSYDFGSGGHRGANSIPAGTYPITPGTIGPWGQRNNAIGINNNAIYDRTLGRMRTGIEFHAASSARKLSAGCVAIARGQYGQFRAHVMDVIRRQGSAYLTVDESGRASITSGAEAAQAATAQTRRLGQRAGAVETPPTAQNRQGNVSLQTPLGQDAPMRGSNAGGSGGISGSGHTFNNNVTVNGANRSPQEIAAAVQLHLQDGMNRRTHDYDGFS